MHDTMVREVRTDPELTVNTCRVPEAYRHLISDAFALRQCVHFDSSSMIDATPIHIALQPPRFRQQLLD